MPQSKKPPKGCLKLDRSRRIRKKSDFALLRKNSKKIIARHWILFFSKSPDGVCRLAVTISGKYGNAVQRNRLRRFLREMFRLNQKRIPGVDLHFIAKQKPAHLEFSRYKEELHEDFERMLNRIS